MLTDIFSMLSLIFCIIAILSAHGMFTLQIDKTINYINLNAHFTKSEELLDIGTIRGLELAKKILGEL